MTTPCAARRSTWRPTREARDGMAGRTNRASIRAPSRCVCHRRHLCVPSRVHRTPPIIGLFGGAATSKLLKSSASEPRGRQESVSAGTLASAKSQGDARGDHGQVRQLSKLRHAGTRRPIIRPARLIHSLLRGGVPMVRLNKPDRDSGLHPLSTPLRHKTIGTILRREITTGHRVFDSDIFAHGSRVTPRWDCGYARRGVQHVKGSSGECAWRCSSEPTLHLLIPGGHDGFSVF